MTEPAVDGDLYAVLQIAFGPLPHGTTWEHPMLDKASDEIAALVHEMHPPGSDADVNMSGKIQAVTTGAVLNWGQADDMTWNEQRAWTGLGHYHSTACLHGSHETCRNTCKHCEAPCNCKCHPKAPAT